MKRIIAVAAMTACLLAVLAVFWGVVREAKTKDVPMQPVRICMKWLFVPTMAPYFAGKEKGVFRRHGLEAELQEGGPANPSVKAVLAGKSDFGITGAEDIIRQRSRDIPIRSVAVIFRNSPVCFVTLKDSGIGTPENFVGKRILVSYGENAEYEFRALMTKFGIERKDYIEDRFMFTYQDLLAGKADVAPAYAMDQALSLRRQGHKINIIKSSDYGINPYGDVLFTTDQTIEERPELVVAVVGSIIECWEMARANLDEVAEIFVEAVPDKGIPVDVARATLEASLYYVQEDPKTIVGYQDARRWQETWDIVTTYANLEKKPVVQDCFTNRFVETYRQTRE